MEEACRPGRRSKAADLRSEAQEWSVLGEQVVSPAEAAWRALPPRCNLGVSTQERSMSVCGRNE